MTLMLIEDTLSEEETVAQQFAPTVKCGWCGEIIRVDGNELALAMCQALPRWHDGRVSPRATNEQHQPPRERSLNPSHQVSS